MRTRPISVEVATEVRVMLARGRRTQGQLARALGVSPASMSRRMNGDQPFTIDELDVVAEWLGCDLADLLPENPRPPDKRRYQRSYALAA